MRNTSVLVVGLVTVLALTGCASGPKTIVKTTPGPTVTVTASPSAAADGLRIGDDISPIEAWDVCVARTQQETASDWTEWAHYSDIAVHKNGAGSQTVTIKSVRSSADDTFKTVTCTVEGRVGAMSVTAWVRK